MLPAPSPTLSPSTLPQPASSRRRLVASTFAAITLISACDQIPLLADFADDDTSRRPKTHDRSDEDARADDARDDAPPPDSCRERWSWFLDRYSATSPIAAESKTSRWKPDDTTLSALLAGQSRIDFSPPLSIDGFAFESLDIADTLAARQMDLHEQIVVRRLTTLIDKTPAKTLVIGHVGLTHALDYFFAGPSRPVRFAAYPFNEDTRFHSPDFARYQTLMGAEAADHTGADQSFSRLRAIYARVWQHTRDSSHALAELTGPGASIAPRAEDADSVNALLIADTDNIRDTTLADTLPDAACVKELGFDAVWLAIDIPRASLSREYTLDDLVGAVDIKSQISESRLAAIKDVSPDAWQLLQDGKVQEHPQLLAILAKARAWIDAGVKVTLTGLE